MDDELFECTVLHEDVVNEVKKKIPEDEMIYDLAEFFKVFADSTRMKIIYALMENELCVCDIANIVQTTQSAISHQLRLLKQSMQLLHPRLISPATLFPFMEECFLS